MCDITQGKHLVGTNLALGCFCPAPRVNEVTLQPNPKKTNCNTSNLNRLGLSESACYKKDPKNCGLRGTNPKLRDVIRGGWLNLDRPHLMGEVPVGDVKKDMIYTDNISRYGGIYPNYNSIPSGQIQYYVDGKLSGAYYEPVFHSPAVVKMDLFTDPMGNVKPQYIRNPLQPYQWKPDHCAKREYCGVTDGASCFSETHDSLRFREDLMERQQRKNLEMEWQPRWVERKC
jgi:hypothetical protein